jgi:hypothetical protein
MPAPGTPDVVDLAVIYRSPGELEHVVSRPPSHHQERAPAPPSSRPPLPAKKTASRLGRGGSAENITVGCEPRPSSARTLDATPQDHGYRAGDLRSSSCPRGQREHLVGAAYMSARTASPFSCIRVLPSAEPCSLNTSPREKSDSCTDITRLRREVGVAQVLGHHRVPDITTSCRRQPSRRWPYISLGVEHEIGKPASRVPGPPEAARLRPGPASGPRIRRLTLPARSSRRGRTPPAIRRVPKYFTCCQIK